GFRIELGEIESTIRQINAIKDVALLINEHEEEKSICAYLVAEKEIDIKQVREELVNQLPAYMIPSHMMQIDYIPVTRNGKLNKAALPKIEVNEESIYVAPRNQAEEKVIEIFQRVLGVNKIGIRDNFFRMGGHSLKATWVMNKIEEQTGIRLPLSGIFSNPTAEGLAQKLINFESDYTQIPRVKIQEKYPMSSVQKRVFAICNDTDTISYNVSWGMETNERVDFGKVNYVLNKLIQQHEILRTHFLVEDGEVYQKVAAEIETKVEYDEIEYANEEDKKRLLMEFIRPFDLETAPLFRIKV
ncbi:condensation domain-containing protein, partial [Bacillus mojavensis]